MTETPNPQKDYAEDMSNKDMWWAFPVLVFVILGIVYMVTWFIPDEPKDTSCVLSSEDWAKISLERQALNLERAKLVCEKKGGEYTDMLYVGTNYRGIHIKGDVCTVGEKDYTWNGDQFIRDLGTQEL